MSIRFVKIWKCDECQREELRENYGLPSRGWTFLYGKHKCEICSTPDNLKEFDRRNRTAKLKPIIAKR